jgi:hypothetical protein
MLTTDHTITAALHREALLTSKRPELQPLIDHLREVAQGRDDIRVEVAGVIDGLDRWVRVGWERRRGASNHYPDGEGKALNPDRRSAETFSRRRFLRRPLCRRPG